MIKHKKNWNVFYATLICSGLTSLACFWYFFHLCSKFQINCKPWLLVALHLARHLWTCPRDVPFGTPLCQKKNPPRATTRRRTWGHVKPWHWMRSGSPEGWNLKMRTRSRKQREDDFSHQGPAFLRLYCGRATTHIAPGFAFSRHTTSR